MGDAVVKTNRMLKIPSFLHFVEDMWFYDFYKHLNQHAIRMHVNVCGWGNDDCPLRVVTANSGWHQDQKYGRVRMLFKVLGIIACGLLKGQLHRSWKILGAVVLLFALCVIRRQISKVLPIFFILLCYERTCLVCLILLPSLG